MCVQCNMLKECLHVTGLNYHSRPLPSHYSKVIFMYKSFSMIYSPCMFANQYPKRGFSYASLLKCNFDRCKNDNN